MFDGVNHLLGFITRDIATDVLEAEPTEDIEPLGGLRPLPMPFRQEGVGQFVREIAICRVRLHDVR